MKKFLLIILVVLILSITSQQVLAALGVWSYKMAWSNFSGSSDAYGAKMVRKLISYPPIWAGDVASYTANPAVTITLGWTYSSALEYCGYTHKQTVTGGARSVSASETATSIFVDTMNCGGTRYGLAYANHEFKYGGQTVRDSWSHQEVIP